MAGAGGRGERRRGTDVGRPEGDGVDRVRADDGSLEPAGLADARLGEHVRRLVQDVEEALALERGKRQG